MFHVFFKSIHLFFFVNLLLFCHLMALADVFSWTRTCFFIVVRKIDFQFLLFHEKIIMKIAKMFTILTVLTNNMCYLHLKITETLKIRDNTKHSL